MESCRGSFIPPGLWRQMVPALLMAAFAVSSTARANEPTTPKEPGSPNATTQSESAEVSLTTLREQVRDLLRKDALVKTTGKDPNPEKDASLTALCDLYVVLRQDKRYAESEMLQQDAGKIRRRLLTLANKKKGRLRREKVPRPAELSGKVDSAIKEAIESSKNGTSDDTLSESFSATSSATEQAKTQPVGRAAGAAMDNGWELVELIERIVEPDFWESQGGPGSIQYFAMRRLLVVRATSDVHEQIRDLLLKLPR